MLQSAWIISLFFLCRWVRDAARKRWNYGVVGWLKVTMWESTTWQRRGAMDWLSAPWSANALHSSKCPIWCKYSTAISTNLNQGLAERMLHNRTAKANKTACRILSSRGVKLCHVHNEIVFFRALSLNRNYGIGPQLEAVRIASICGAPRHTKAGLGVGSSRFEYR